VGQVVEFNVLDFNKILKAMLTSVSMTLVKKIKKVSFALKTTFSTLLGTCLHKFQKTLTILVCLTSS